MLIHQSHFTKKFLSIPFILSIVFCFLLYYYWNVFSEDSLSYSFDLSIRSKVNRTHYPKEAFITVTNSQKNYVELLNVLLDSVHLFSTRPIIIFTIDFDLIINSTRHSRVLIERISQKDCGPTVFGCKYLGIVSSEVNYGVQLDVDSVVNYNIDFLFDMLHIWPYDFPLAPKHPDDPKNYKYYMKEYRIKSQTIPYIHGTFVWTYRAYPFLQHILRLMQKGAFTDANCDETAMNIMLWKAKVKYTLCKYDPYGPIFIDKYEQNETVTKCSPYCDGVYLIFHGQKDSSISKNILERLQKLGPHHPFVQTPEGLKSFNDTNVTCCHPLATKTSSLHPLLCEYHNYKNQII